MELKNKRVLVVGLGKSGFSAAGFDRGFAGCADGYSGGEAGCGVWAAGDWGAGAGEPLFARSDCGDYGVEWEDDDYDFGGEDICRCGCADACGWEYWVACDRPCGEEYAGDGECARGVELPVGDVGGVSSVDCGGVEYHSGPS